MTLSLQTSSFITDQKDSRTFNKWKTINLQRSPFMKQVIPSTLVLFVSPPAKGNRPRVKNWKTTAKVISVCTAMNHAVTNNSHTLSFITCQRIYQHDTKMVCCKHCTEMYTICKPWPGLANSWLILGKLSLLIFLIKLKYTNHGMQTAL